MTVTSSVHGRSFKKKVDEQGWQRGGRRGQPFNVVSVVRAANPSGGCLGIAIPHGADKYLFNALMHAAAVAIRPVNLSEEAQCC